MGESVLVDSEWTLTQVLRPPAGFEQVYQGQDASIPIAFPGTLDPRAGEPGFDPRLLAALPCAFGSRVKFLFPNLTAPDVEAPPPAYTYTIIWRLRNPTDYRADRRPFHFPKQTPGVPDTSLMPPQPRFVIPALQESVVYTQPEPSGLPGPEAAVQHLRREMLTVKPLDPPQTPFIVGGIGGIGSYQQGVIDPSFAPFELAKRPTFLPYETRAQGDEVMVVVVREFAFPPNSGPPQTPWDFAGQDRAFANFYGVDGQVSPHPAFSDLGIMVLFGTPT